MKTVLNPKEFSPSYPVIIVDSWDFKSALGNDLLNLHKTGTIETCNVYG
jgi:hypothetical protein